MGSRIQNMFLKRLTFYCLKQSLHKPSIEMENLIKKAIYFKKSIKMENLIKILSKIYSRKQVLKTS